MASILITGGAGYIGSVVTEALREAGRDIVVLDSLVAGHREAVRGDVPFYKGDIADTELLERIAQRHDIRQVVHLAALVSVSESVAMPLKYFANNTAKVISMLETLIKHGLKNVVFSSTAATYGDARYVPVDEAHPQNPTHPYGISKHIVEQILDWLEKAHGLTYVSLRYFNAAGATETHGEDHSPETHLIPLVLRVPMGLSESIAIYGTDYPTPDGTCIRDYVHVSDLADAHLKALEYLEEGNASEKFNLGNSVGFSVREVVNTAEKITGMTIQTKEQARRSGDPAVLVASSDKARKILRWAPRYPELDSIVRSAWEWHRMHPAGYRG